MNQFKKNIRKWQRKDWDPSKTPEEAARRQRAETETDHDLQKPAQQFLCDVHEEADHPWPDKPYDKDMTLAESRIVASLVKLAGVHKRTTALLTVNAHEAALTNWLLKGLTVVLVLLTVVLVVATILLLRVASHTDEQIEQIREHAEFYRQQKENTPAGNGQKDGIRR